MSSTESETPVTESVNPVDAAGETEASRAPDHPPSVRLASIAGDETLLERVVAGVREVYDPEIPLNIYDLGLIYRIDISAEGHVAIDMTLTSPMCPVAESLPGEVEMAARGVDGVSDVVIELVWDPPWGPEVMSEAARLELGIF
jgi:FeS assembly SUF system protein